MAGRPSPEVASIRGRVAALSRDRSPDDPEYTAARRDLRAAKAEEYITRLVNEAPPLTHEQRDKLANLLRPRLEVGGPDAA